MEKAIGLIQSAAVSTKGFQKVVQTKLKERNPRDENHAQLLRERDFSLKEIDQRLIKNRSVILDHWINNARDYLELKWKTIDLAIILFDFYC